MILSHVAVAALAAWAFCSLGWPGLAAVLVIAAAVGVASAAFARRQVAARVQEVRMAAEKSEAEIGALVSSRDELTAVLSCVTDGLVAIDAEDQITHANAEAIRLFGGGALVNRPRYWEFVRDKCVVDLVAQARATGRAVEGEMMLAHLTPRCEIEVRIAPKAAPGAPWSGAVLAFRDVTRIHKLEAVRRDFVANVSHEMKTPLTSILGYIETLQGGALDDAAVAREFLGKIERNANNLGHLVTDLLVLSRVEAGGIELEEEPFPVTDVVSEAVSACAEKAREKNLDLRVTPGPRDARVRGDRDLLVRALVNLLDNAIQYTRAGGRIVVSVAPAGHNVDVAVADTGLGIAAHELGRIFERFYRVDKARSRALGGTGLGLAIVKHVAERHGGSVRVTSEEGRGSTFTLSLPAVAP